jgi:hypothetical protein
MTSPRDILPLAAGCRCKSDTGAIQEREILRAFRKDPTPYHAITAVAIPATAERKMSCDHA